MIPHYLPTVAGNTVRAERIREAVHVRDSGAIAVDSLSSVRPSPTTRVYTEPRDLAAAGQIELLLDDRTIVEVHGADLVRGLRAFGRLDA